MSELSNEQINRAIRERVSNRKMDAEMAKYQFYISIKECAKAAAPIFKANNWKWFDVGVPSESDIFITLYHLEDSAKQSNTDNCQSGRLMYFKGKFGHLKV